MPDEAKKRPPWFWLKDDRGTPSVTVTFTSVAFVVTTFAYVASVVEGLKVLGQEVNFRTFDVAACSAYFVPILTLYFGRKFTKARYGGGHGGPEDKASGMDNSGTDS